MKPTDLDDVTPPEPGDDALARVHARSKSFRRRRSMQRLASIATGALVVVVAGGIALARVDAGNDRVNEPVPTATSTPPTTTTTGTAATKQPSGVPTVADIVGPWRPVSIAGYTRSLAARGPGLEPSLDFSDNGTWGGSDGCNGITGTYHLRSGGAFTFAVVGSTDVGCNGFPPAPESLVATTRVELVDGRLSFFASDEHELAQYVRAAVTARVELSLTTITAGSSITATVVVENNTGRALHSERCGNYFQVVLGNAGVWASVGWRDCRQDFTLPGGESRYPVPVSANYLSCSAGGDPIMGPACLANGDPPPLPPGEYQATLYQSGNAVPLPPPNTVQVVAQPS